MDNFKMPTLEKHQESLDLCDRIIKEKQKFFDCAQLDCIPCHLGLAVAMKNYWIYQYDLIQK